MTKRNEFEELQFKEQGLHEAIGLVKEYQDLLSKIDLSDEPETFLDEFDSLGPRTADIQSRFKPHLSSLGLFASEMNFVQVRLEDNQKPAPSALASARNNIENLTSEFRLTQQALDKFETWVRADHGDLLLEVAGLMEAISNVKNIFLHSNSLAMEKGQTEILRNTVIQLLSSAVEELKAPAVNVNRLHGISSMLRSVLKKSVEKKLGEAADSAIEQAVSQAEKVTDLAKDLPGLDNLF